MKNAQKVTRIKLNIETGTDFILLGLVSSEPDYKLSLSINRVLNFSLKNGLPVILNDDKDTEFHFSRFTDISDSPERVVHLVANRSGKGYFIRKLKNIDYIFYIYDPENQYNGNAMISKLRDIPVITAVFPVDTDIITDKNIRLIME